MEQDDASRVLHCSPLPVSADPGIAMVPGVARHRHLLPRLGGLQVPSCLHEDRGKGPPVSTPLLPSPPHPSRNLFCFINRGSMPLDCAVLPGQGTVSLSLLEVKAGSSTSHSDCNDQVR